jgi:RimJ/RimL family protein N-acetyltransferase
MVSKKKTPCIVYYRQRSADRRANNFAHIQQIAAEDYLLKHGYDVIDCYGDEEFVGPYAGLMEPRPAWQLALDRAAKISIAEGDCPLFVLRQQGIGESDPFIPEIGLTEEYANIDIRLFDASNPAIITQLSLSSAHMQIKNLKHREHEEHSGKAIRIQRKRRSANEVIFLQDPWKKLVRAYFANHSDQLMLVRWQKYPLLDPLRIMWPRSVSWAQFKVAPNCAFYLKSFVQGDPDLESVRWRFKIGKKRKTKVGNVLVSPQHLTASSLKVNWYPYEPEGLKHYDFAWEDAPNIETSRIAFRNWEAGDAERYAGKCNTEEVMKFLGGRQWFSEVLEDVEYFKQLGKTGPTYWPIELKQGREFIGFCGLLKIEETGSPLKGLWEIGWRLSEDAQGKGLAFEASAAVLQAAFENWGIDHVTCRINRLNHASRMLAERLGLRKNRSLAHRPEGELEELVVYEMNREQFYGMGRRP